jgi:hypothetical protein
MDMRGAIFASILALAATAAPARAELHVSMHDGLVTVAASDVTVRQILAEWARVGQTKIVNGDGVPGGPVTLQITDMPEQQALDILLRSAAGYLAAPRPVQVPTASHFDRIVITPSSASSNTPVSATRATPQIQARPQASSRPEPDDDSPAPPPPFAPQAPAGAAPAAFPQAGPPPAQPAPQVPTSMPSAPAGLSLPGTVVPAPPAAGQPGQTSQPAGR